MDTGTTGTWYARDRRVWLVVVVAIHGPTRCVLCSVLQISQFMASRVGLIFQDTSFSFQRAHQVLSNMLAVLEEVLIAGNRGWRRGELYTAVALCWCCQRTLTRSKTPNPP